MSWRDYVYKELPGTKDLGSASEPFHLFNPESGEAISTQILYSLDPSYINNPPGIYDALKICVDAVVGYTPSAENGLALAQVKSKTIHLAVPERTSSVQWHHLLRAIIYGKENGVSIVITKIRE